MNERKKLDTQKIEEAFLFAKEAHKHQTRKSGEPYIIHPVAVATLVCKAGGDDASILAALLHDTVEDTDVTLEDIERLFGKEVADLVDGLTKITQSKFRNAENLNDKIESLRKWLEVLQSDIRVAVIKIYDRLHNMSTLSGHSNKEKQRRIAQETLEIYIKVAEKLCMNQVRRKLEELALLYIDEGIHAQLKKIQKRETIESHIIQQHITQYVQGADYKNKVCKIRYEPVPIIAMYRNGLQERDSLKGMLNYIFVVTTKTIEDCYYVLFLIHSIWKSKKHNFEDFISTPRPNGLQEIRTKVLIDEGVTIEFRIRTIEMDEYAQDGITKFCFSKNLNSQNILWIKHLSYVTQIETDNSYNFLTSLHNDIMGQSIVIYTEKDEPIVLPANATALDAAFYLYEKRALKLQKIALNGFEVDFGINLNENDTIHFFFTRNNTCDSSWKEKTKTALANFIIRKAV